MPHLTATPSTTSTTYAHVYKARGGAFNLLITTGPAISEGVLSNLPFDNRALAKAHARAAGAKPHNY